MVFCLFCLFCCSTIIFLFISCNFLDLDNNDVCDWAYCCEKLQINLVGKILLKSIVTAFKWLRNQPTKWEWKAKKKKSNNNDKWQQPGRIANWILPFAIFGHYLTHFGLTLTLFGVKLSNTLWNCVHSSYSIVGNFFFLSLEKFDVISI